MQTHDQVFVKKFSRLIAFLIVVAVGLMTFAHYLNSHMRYNTDPGQTTRQQERIAPVGDVFAGTTGAAAQAAAAQAAAAAQVADVPFGGRADGAEIFNNGPCTGCHTAGVGGAPKLDAAGIGARVAAQGVEELIKKATSGFTGTTGTMPAKGGNPALTEAQMKAVVEWMVGQSK